MWLISQVISGKPQDIAGYLPFHDALGLVGVVNIVAVTIYIAEYLLSLGFLGFVAFVVSAARRGGERLIGVSSLSLCSFSGLLVAAMQLLLATRKNRVVRR
jgi:hypothetical protein